MEIKAPVVEEVEKIDAELEEEEEEEEEEESVSVKAFEIDGKKYLKSSTNILYDAATQDMVGMWNEATKSIDFTEESEDSEEEDE